MKLIDRKLGEGLHVKHGFAFLGQFFSDQGKYILLTPGNFYEEGGFKARPEKDRFYTGIFPNDYILQKGDLIVAMTEQGPGLLGSAAFIPENDMYLHNQRLGLVDKINPEIFEKRYLFHIFNSRSVRSQLYGSATGTKVKHTSPGRIYKVKVSVPEAKKQGEISSILENYFELIDINRKRILFLEEAARLLFREWFVYFRFPGHEKAEFEDHDGIRIPAGWDREPLSKFVVFKRGVEPGTESYLENQEIDTFPFYRVSNLITRKPEIFVDELQVKGALLEKKDIVVSLDGSVGIVSMGLEGCYSSGIRKLIIKAKRINRAFLYCLMKSYYIQGIIRAYSKGTTIQHAGEAIKHMNPVLPSQNLIDKFGGIVEPMIDQILTLFEQNKKLAQARDLLLPRLMSGKIEV
jgi:type I restriction enzyme, S subunit